MADVSHVNPDTSETFWAVYRRGPAMADGGEEPPRPGADDRHGRTRRNGSGRPDGTDESMADVSHEPPYPEANDVWTRGFERPSNVGSDE
ncbi:hypothetical protein HUG10_00345 [Halorarum halophilum]|uniref:Uncharacterized protein n=2 Tax=Halorarum halophilum TaxID=2743090 RepID=A0A7D5KNK1_9EURY|nr:hypothetical protein HUG10_00345 [Halobaculum halophilum]